MNYVQEFMRALEKFQAELKKEAHNTHAAENRLLDLRGQAAEARKELDSLRSVIEAEKEARKELEQEHRERIAQAGEENARRHQEHLRRFKDAEENAAKAHLALDAREKALKAREEEHQRREEILKQTVR